ncbi:MG2 domain-containing protein [Limnoraphis robusta Tam1]|uniref:alpha-2-macroglobulin family protein n=1 Tax=Limnoraphis robusta TaxID=1118279 RepID=UPI002B1F00B2|nr:MG2 domain-containing protein [Limnoraphis robusta]MEA5537835.1 MG2 domain-containing protein [Limnoraphis robusta Tam1]
MGIQRQYRQLGKRLILIFLFIATLAGCRIFSMTPTEEPLPTVSALAVPQLPDWIEKITPTGEVKSLSQIQIIFKQPLIPVERLDSPEQRQLLNQFEITPQLPGQFRFLTPRMVGFQADRALPLATRIQVKLKQGLSDLENHRLDQDLAWTFNTESIQLTNLPGTEENPGSADNPVGLTPNLTFNSNVELDLDSLTQHTKLVSEASNQAVPLKAELTKNQFNSESLPPQTQFDPSNHIWQYTITPTESLQKSTKYTLQILPGLHPKRGNLDSQFLLSSQIKTFDSLQFETLQAYGQPSQGGTYGRFENGSPQLKFNNQILEESARENITINPPPPQDAPPLVQTYGNSDIINLNPWALEPQTNYTITIGKDLKDQFGQTLEKPVTISYQTGDVAADLWAPTGLNIFPSTQNLQLNIATTNLPQSRYTAAYKIVEPTDLVYTDVAYPRENKKNLLPGENNWTSFSVKNPKNETQETSINLRRKLGKETGMLAYGVKARTTRYQEEGRRRWNEPEFYGFVQLTNLGVFSQWFPESGIIKVNHLEDGSPVNNASVEIYPSQLEAETFSTPKPCATGNTNESGIWVLNAEDLQQCMQGDRFTEAPELLVIAKEADDWAFTRTYSYSGVYGYGINSDWENNKPLSRGVIFSDRQLYQPGEKVALTGVAYYLQNGELKQDKNVNYTVTLRTSDGKEKTLGSYPTNEFGTFSLEFTLDEDQALGDYSLSAKAENEVEIYGDLRVAEFKPPNFKVELNLDKETAIQGETLTANTESNYLFGSPVVGGKAEYYVTRTATEFTPKGWEQYNFGRQWFWPEEKPTLSSDVLQKSKVLDQGGKGTQTVKIDKDLPYPVEYRVDVQVSDVTNLAVSDSQSLTALPSNRLIGLKTPFVAEANKAFPIEVVVTDPNGKALSNIGVRLELQKMNYSNVTRVVAGGQTPKNQVEYKTVATTEVKSNKTPKTVSLTPPESGSYRIQANFSNNSSEATATDLQIWATGDSPVFWGENNDNRLQIELDKDTYKPGETATALIKSPYPEGELYFAVVRDKPLYESLTTVTGGAPQIQFTVTSEMLPNAAVEAVLVRQGEPLSEVEPGSVENLSQIGFVPFKTDLAEKTLNVTITPTKSEVEPGSEQTLQLQLTDANNQPKRGQFTVMVVNEAILQLTGYRPPNLLETVYAEQPISTRFSDNRPEVALDSMASQLAKGWGYGGGFSAGIGNTRIRKNFQALAYYQGSIVTDNSGKANVTFKLPDDLTTWRVMVVATDGNFKFGSGETTFISTQSLLSNPILPQFARPGDKILAGVSVTNNTGNKGMIDIKADVAGGVKLSPGNANTQSIKRPLQAGTQAYYFPVLVQDVGTSQVKFQTAFDGKTDGFEVPLEVKPVLVTEQVIESGTTTNSLNIPINVSRDTVRDTGGLYISLASTLIPQITAPAKQIFNQTDLPFLEPAASQLLIASNLQQLSQKYGQNFSELNLNAQAQKSLEQIFQLQQNDGGLAVYPEQKTSNPLLSAYAAEALAKASQAGFKVDENKLNQLEYYLKQALANPEKNEFCGDDLLCKSRVRLNILMALAQLGEKRNDFMSDIYGLRDEFDTVTQIKLARYLSNFPEWNAEFNELVNKLQEIVYQTGRTATVNIPKQYGWMSSDITAQSQALRLLVSQNSQPETIDKLLQSLLNLRREGTWGSTYNNAEALTALAEYAALEPTPENFQVQVKLGGKDLGSTQFNGFKNSSFTLNIPMSELPPGKNNLMIQTSGNGKLNYWVSYEYRLEGNQPGRLNGLRIERKIQRVNESEVLKKMGLTAEEEPLEVQPGQVFDIGLEIITDHPVNNVMITDPLPAGFEAIDNRFNTSNSALQAQTDSWNINYQTIYKDRIFAYADSLEAGVYQLHYLVRSVTPGEFLWPGAKAYLQQAPEEFGRSSSSSLVISEQS